MNHANWPTPWNKPVKSPGRPPKQKPGSSTLKLTLLVVLMPLLLTACSKHMVIQPLDPRLTQPVHEPVLKGDTWRDVGVLSVEQKESINECNARMRAIRESAPK